MRLPKNMQVIETDAAFEIHWRWRFFWGDPHSHIRLGCGLSWLFGTLGLLIIYTAATANWIITYILLALMLLASYFVGARFINRTIIRIDSETLQIRHGPLPYPGQKHIRLTELNKKPVTVKRRVVVQPRRGAGSDFWVQATLKGGKQINLLKAIPDRDDAEFIASRINRFRTRLRSQARQPGHEDEA